MNKYNVILTYKDGSAFDCAVGVSLERAEQIKAEIEQQQSENAFSYQGLKSIAITQHLDFKRVYGNAVHPQPALQGGNQNG